MAVPLREENIDLIDIISVTGFFNEKDNLDIDPTKFTINDFFFLAKMEGRITIFQKKEKFNIDDFFLNEHTVRTYLQEKHNLKLQEGHMFYDQLMIEINKRNDRLFLLDEYNSQTVSISLMFNSSDGGYRITFKEKWYTKLLETHQTVEEIIDSYVKKHSYLLNGEVE